MTAEQVLTDAGAILADPQHWYKGWFNNSDNTAFCAKGAVHKVTEDFDLRKLALGILGDVIAEQYPDTEDVGEHRVTLFNDDPSRKHDELMSVFQKSVMYAAEKGL